MKYTGVVISDIHFGAFDCKQLSYELNEVFLKYIQDMKKLDYVIIDGDYFDHKIYLNNPIVHYAITFMDSLVKLSIKRKFPIRIVYGTDSHEVNQYFVFNNYENDPDIDFKVIKTVTEEELLPDMKVLYLPEEYVYSELDHYKNFINSNNKYNYIFGHGTISDIMSYINTKNTSTERKHVAVFKASDLMDCCDGEIYFGHYHVNSNIDNRVFYVGSYSRWEHGEDAPKGFYHIEYDTTKNKYTHHFIENPCAKKYVTITFGYNSKALNSEEDLMKELNKRDKLIESENADYVRYIFNIPETHENPEFIIKILNERYKFDDKIKYDITNGYIEKKKKINKQKLNEVIQEFPFIFDKSQQLEDKVMYFIKKRYDYDIDINSVKKILYDNDGET